MDPVALDRKRQFPRGTGAFRSRRLISQGGQRCEGPTRDAGIPEIAGENPRNSEPTEVVGRLFRNVASRAPSASFRPMGRGTTWFRLVLSRVRRWTDMATVIVFRRPLP